MRSLTRQHLRETPEKSTGLCPYPFPFQIPGDTPHGWIALAVADLRFSDENSNPRSLDQQLLNVLNRARREGVFVPWHYVLADAAVSGTLTCRTGYTLAK